MDLVAACSQRELSHAGARDDYLSGEGEALRATANYRVGGVVVADVSRLLRCCDCAMSGIFDHPRRSAVRRVTGAEVAAAVSSFPIRRSVEQRRVVLLAAVAMFAAVLVLRQTSADSADVIALLAVVPIALVALEFGLLVGVAAAILALGLVGALALDVHSGTVGLYTAAAAYLGIGAVAGRFGDRMRDAQARQHLLLKSGLALAHLDGADGLAATLAQRAREVGASRGARVELSGEPTVESGIMGNEDEQESVPIDRPPEDIPPIWRQQAAPSQSGRRDTVAVFGAAHGLLCDGRAGRGPECSEDAAERRAVNEHPRQRERAGHACAGHDERFDLGREVDRA